MGVKEKSGAEASKNKPDKTDTGTENKKTSNQSNQNQQNPPNIPTSSRLIELSAILSSIESPQNLWPREALRAVITKYTRMPRNGWNILQNTYNKKFECNETTDKLKNIAETDCAKIIGKKVRRSEYIDKHKKKLKSNNENLLKLAKENEKSLKETALHTKISTTFNTIYKEVQNKEVKEACRTKKKKKFPR